MQLSGVRKRRRISSDIEEDPLGSKRLKRHRDPSKWKKNLQKTRRIHGLRYKTRYGVRKPAKEFIDHPCRCARNCSSQILAEIREKLMKDFYNLQSTNEQNIFLRGCIQTSEVRRLRPISGVKAPRNKAFSYFLRINNESTRVCKKYFKDTYQISDHRIHKNCSEEMVSSLTRKGIGRTPLNKIDDSHIVSHINSFPSYTSH